MKEEFIIKIIGIIGGFIMFGLILKYTLGSLYLSEKSHLKFNERLLLQEKNKINK